MCTKLIMSHTEGRKPFTNNVNEKCVIALHISRIDIKAAFHKNALSFSSKLPIDFDLL